MPSRYVPQLPLLVAEPPTGAGWVHELKHDGYRIGAHVDGASVLLESRRGRDWTSSFPNVVEALQALALRGALFDGEVVLQRPDGTADFGGLRSVAGRRDARVLFYVFDLLELAGENLRPRPLLERKARLRELLAGSEVLKYVEHLDADGHAVFEAARRLGVEGIVSKRSASPYRDGQRSSDWQKTKAVKEEEFHVCGFLSSAGAALAALHLAEEVDGQWRYAGKVGTGFQRIEASLLGSLRKLVIPSCPLPAQSRPVGKDYREALWTKPELVVEVAFLERGDDGGLRHPTFRRVCGAFAEE